MFEITDNSVIGIYAKAAQPSKSSKALNIMFWVLQFLAAVACLTVGATKLRHMREASLEKLGFGDWLSYCAASVKVISAFLMMISTTAQLGAAVLAGTMVGVIIVHLLMIGRVPIPALVLLAITVAVAWYRGWHD
jgi:hypothetical protein